MFERETAERLDDVLTEALALSGTEGLEVGIGADVGVKGYQGFPVKVDPYIPHSTLQVRYVSKSGKVRIVAEWDIALEVEALSAAKDSVRINPPTVDEMVADYYEKKMRDDAAIEESKAALAAGEITEDELYQGNFHLQHGMYPLHYRSAVRGRGVYAYLPVTISYLENVADDADKLLAMADERLRYQIKHTAYEYLTSQV
jgi:hypothetical protein